MDNNNGGLIIPIEADTTQYTEGMRTVSQSTDRTFDTVDQRLRQSTNNTTRQVNESMARVSESMSNVGSKISSVGNKMTLGLTVPIVGLGVASAKLASDLNENMNKVNVCFKESAEEVLAFGETTLESYGISRGTALNMASLFGDMGTSIGLSTAEASKMSMSLVGLAGDLASFKNISVDIAKTALNGIFSGETESLKQLGVVMTQQNLLQYAVSSGMIKNVKDEADVQRANIEHEKALKDLNEAIKKYGENSLEARDAKLKMEETDAKANQTAKASLDTLTQAQMVQLRYNYVLANTKNAQGDFARTLDGTANQARVFQESLKQLGETFGQKILPIVTPVIQRVNELLKSFANLSPEMQGTILKTGLFVATLGPLLSIGGKVVSVGGNLVGAFSRISTALGVVAPATGSVTGLLGALGTVALPVGLAVAGIGTTALVVAKSMKYWNETADKSSEEMGFLESSLGRLQGGYVHTKDELVSMGLRHEDWSNKISPETQKSLDKIAQKVTSYSLAIRNSAKLNELADEKVSKMLTDKVAEICDSAINKIKEKQPEMAKELQVLYNADGVIDAQEQRSLDILNKGSNAQIETIQNKQAKILELNKKASAEQGEEQSKTIAEAQKMLEEIAQIEADYTYKSNEEKIAAKANFLARIQNMDLNGISEELQAQAKARDEANAKTAQSYNEQIEFLKLHLSELSAEEKKVQVEQIKKLTETRDKTIKLEDEKYKSLYEIAVNGNSNIDKSIVASTGKKLSSLQIQEEKYLETYTKDLENINKITESGYYKIKNTTTGRMNDCYVEVDKISGKITYVWNDSMSTIIGNPIRAKEDIRADIKNGVIFKNIEQKYIAVQTDIANNPLLVNYTKAPTKFEDWITAQRNTQRWFDNNPIQITRNYETMMTPSAGQVGRNATGDDSFGGGFTTLHENGYELYNLPSGTRIYNHDASEDLLLKTAREVAMGVLRASISKLPTAQIKINTNDMNSYRQNNIGASRGTAIIENKITLDGKTLTNELSPKFDVASGNRVQLNARRVGIK